MVPLIILLGWFRDTTGQSFGDALTKVLLLVTLGTGIEKLAGRGFIWEWFKKHLTYKKEINKRLVGFETSQAEQTEMLIAIKKELQFNGQGSTKDAVYRTEKKVDDIVQRQIKMFGRQRALFDASPTCFFIIDNAGLLVYVNPAYCKALGVTDPNTLYGNGWIELIPPQDRAETIEAHEMRVEIPNPVNKKLRLVHQGNGQYINVHCRTEINKENGVVEVVGTIEILD